MVFTRAGLAMHYTERPEYQAHLAGIIAEPNDDLRRLVLCDWLEELPGSLPCPACRGSGYAFPSVSSLEEMIESRMVNGEVIRTVRMVPPSYKLPPRCLVCHGAKVVPHDAAERAAAIRHQIHFRYNGQVVGHAGDVLTAGERGFDAIPSIDLAGVVFRRGFVDEIRCTLADWCGGECPDCDLTNTACPTCRRPWSDSEPTGFVTGIGPQIVRRHPVTKVVTGISVHEFDGGVAWVLDDSGVVWRGGVPSGVFCLIETQWHRANGVQKAFVTQDEAISALSAALIAWAKSYPVTPPPPPTRRQPGPPASH